MREEIFDAKYKIGDKVICIGDFTDKLQSGSETIPNTSAGAGWVKGKEFIIRRVTKATRRYQHKGNIYWPEGESHGIFEIGI